MEQNNDSQLHPSQPLTPSDFDRLFNYRTFSPPVDYPVLNDAPSDEMRDDKSCSQNQASPVARVDKSVLPNFAGSPRCGARTRTNGICTQPAMWSEISQRYVSCRKHGGRAQIARAGMRMRTFSKASLKDAKKQAAELRKQAKEQAGDHKL